MQNQAVLACNPDVHIIRKNEQFDKMVRVGAYCRVSTNLEEQKTSLETQIMAYSRIIDEHPGWVLAGIYADEGLSGTSVRKRVEFLRMIADAKQGKINYILVKSISRFSRNTVDLLNYVRDLKQVGVNVYFEKERIDTGKTKSEFLLSLFAAMAQEEIVSLSNNIKVGRRMRAAQGINQWSPVYGYRKGWIIDSEEASTVRRIFELYLGGTAINDICRILNDEGVPSPQDKKGWFSSTVANIMKNEKYAGHVLIQKSYVTDPVTQSKVSNRNATIPQYFIRNHHAPIVDESAWNAARLILTMKDTHRGTNQYPFYGILKCPFCGGNMVRFEYHYGLHLWTCGGNQPGITRGERSNCPPYSVDDEALTQSIKAAGLPVQYWALSQKVKTITFPKDDWNKLLVSVVDGGGALVEIPIVYRMPSLTPMPVVTEEVRNPPPKRKRMKQSIMYVNGIQVPAGAEHMVLRRINTLREMVQSLIILPPETYEMDVPRVSRKTIARKYRDDYPNHSAGTER